MVGICPAFAESVFGVTAGSCQVAARCPIGGRFRPITVGEERLTGEFELIVAILTRPEMETMPKELGLGPHLLPRARAHDPMSHHGA